MQLRLHFVYPGNPRFLGTRLFSVGCGRWLRLQACVRVVQSGMWCYLTFNRMVALKLVSRSNQLRAAPTANKWSVLLGLLQCPTPIFSYPATILQYFLALWPSTFGARTANTCRFRYQRWCSFFCIIGVLGEIRTLKMKNTILRPFGFLHKWIGRSLFMLMVNIGCHC